MPIYPDLGYDDIGYDFALRNIFGLAPQGVNDVNNNPTDVYNPNDRLKELYHPSHTAQDQYTQLLQQYPQRTEPSKMRKFGAMLSALGTVRPAGITNGQVVGMQFDPGASNKAYDQFANDKFYEKLGDWENKVKPFESAAQNERYSNQNERQLAETQIGREISDRRADVYARDQKRKEAADAERARANQVNEGIRQQRANTYNFKTTHPNHIIKENDKGELVAIDPQNNSTLILADEDGKPIKSSILTDADKINLQVQGKLKEIAAQGGETRTTESLRQQGRIELEGEKEKGRATNIEARGEQARKTKTTTPATAPKPATTRTKTTTDSKGNITAKEVTTTESADAKRQLAIQTLTKANKPITEANIAYVMKQLGQ